MRQAIVLLLLAVFAAVALVGCGGKGSRAIRVIGRATGPDPEAVEVRVYQVGHVGEAEYLITSIVGAKLDGSFELYVPEEGPYDIDVGYVRYLAADGEMTSYWEHVVLEDVTVSAPSTDTGTIQLPEPTP